MRNGQMRHRITIQSPPTGQDSFGDPQTDWTTFATIRAEKSDVDGREFFAAQAAQNPVQTQFKIRYRAGILAKMRVVEGAAYYNIEAVLDRKGSKRELFLMCSTGVTNG
jgi:SPP1 family predicted phage head-tail adaptor